MLRNEKFFQGFKEPVPLSPVYQFEGEDVVTNSDGKSTHQVVRHYVRPVIDNTMSAEDFDLKILIDSGVQLKPCPPYSSVSLDELSELNKHLNEEQITQKPTEK